MERRPTRWRSILIPLFYVALAVFLVLYLKGTDWSGLADLDLRPFYLLLAIPFSLAPRLLQPVAWSILIRDYGDSPPSYPQITLVYAKSWLGRYIPGKVAWIAGKVLFGSRHGIRPAVLTVTSVAEAGIQMASALGLSFLLFAVAGESERIAPGLRLFAFLAFLPMVAALAPPVFNTVVSRVHSVVARGGPKADLHLSFPSFLGAAGLYTVIHALSALPLYLLLEAIYAPLSPMHIPYLTAAFLLAGTLGTLAVAAPAGIGFREGFLIVLLGVVLPKEVTVVAVVFLRLWSIAMDLLFYTLAELMERVSSARRHTG